MQLDNFDLLVGDDTIEYWAGLFTIPPPYPNPTNTYTEPTFQGYYKTQLINIQREVSTSPDIIKFTAEAVFNNRSMTDEVICAGMFIIAKVGQELYPLDLIEFKPGEEFIEPNHTNIYKFLITGKR